MDSSSGLTFKKVLLVGIGAAFVCTVVVAGAFVYLNKKTAAGIQRNVILDDITSTSSAEDLGPREGGIFTRMGILNPPLIEEPPKPVATPTPEIVATTTIVKAAPVVKPKPKPKPQPVIEEDTSNTDVTVDDGGDVTTEDPVVEDNSVPVQDNPGI